MSVLGVPVAWAGVIDPMVPEILRLVVETWVEIPSPPPDQREDDISNRLCVALRQKRDVRDLPFYVLPQMVILEPEAGAELGRTDIAFLPTGAGVAPRETIYFCLECKRLNVIKEGSMRTYASEYVKFGMVRFVTGQYSHLVRHGGMVGYVLNGDVPSAIGNVEQNIVKQRAALLTVVPPAAFRASDYLPANPHARETHHRRAHDAIPFRIHHLFMGGDPKLAAAALVAGAAAKEAKQAAKKAVKK
jgi:hypothetical protein